LPSIDSASERSETAARAFETALTKEARALYEESVVPVREIARLAGVGERTLYKYVQKGGWRRRYRVVVRGALSGAAEADARDAAECGRREASPGIAPVKGAGGRFVVREAAGLPHAAGLGALDPARADAAAAACVEAGATSEAAVAQASAQMQARSRLRCLDHLSAALGELGKFWRESVQRAPSPQAEALAARLHGAILVQMTRLIAPR
jgi:hypothetical protein